MRANQLVHRRRLRIKAQSGCDLRSHPGIEELIIFAESDDPGTQDRDEHAYLQEALDLGPEITTGQAAGPDAAERATGVEEFMARFPRNAADGMRASKDMGFAKPNSLSPTAKGPEFSQHCHSQNVHWRPS